MDGTLAERLVICLKQTKESFLIHSKNKFTQYVQKERAVCGTLMSLQRLQEMYPRCHWIEVALQQARVKV